MNISIFTDAFLPQVNGVVTHVIETATELTKRGHKTIVFAPKPRRNVIFNLSAFPFKIVLIPSLPSLMYPDIRMTIPSLPKVLFELKKFDAEIVHIHAPFTIGTDGVMAGKIMKLPLVITFHTFFADEKMLQNLKLDKFSSYIQDPLWRLLVYYHRLADVVICPSKISQRELENHGLRKESTIIPNGIDLSIVKKLSQVERDKERKKYGLRPTDLAAVYVGRLAVDKSVDILLYAWKKVAEKFPNASFLIVGSGPKEKNLQALADGLRIAKQVIFTGKMTREEIYGKGFLDLADIYVTASKIENQSYSMLEAMAYGLPIVAVAIRGTLELVDEKNGILIVPDDPQNLATGIIQLFSNREKMKLLGKASLEKVKSFDLAKTVSQLERLYQELIIKKKRRRNII